jgi:streptomycin 6-kinase
MNSFEKMIISRYGETGQEWLTNLPKLITHLAQKWDLEILEPYENLSYHYVVRVSIKKNNQPAVLKIGLDEKVTQEEIATLTFYNGYGCVKLLAHHSVHSALLLEQLDPGTPLSTLFPKEDSAAVNHAYEVMKQLHISQLGGSHVTKFRHVKDVVGALDTVNPNAIPLSLLNKARECTRRLVQSQTNFALLHGDLHQDNILSGRGSQWVAIDPKGIIGEPAFEMASFIYNPITQLADCAKASELIHHRIVRFSKLSSIREIRIKEWAFARAVLSACWNSEENLSPDNFLKVAHLIDNC